MNSRKIILVVFFIAIAGIIASVVNYSIEANTSKQVATKIPMNSQEMPDEIPQAMKEAMQKQGMGSGMSSSNGSMNMMNMSQLFSNPDVSQEFATKAGDLMMKMKEDPNNVENLLDLARLFYEAKDPIATLNFANRANTIDPLSADAAYLVGVAHAQLNEPSEAVAAFERAIKIKDSAEARYNLGIVYLHALNDKEKAKIELEKALAMPELPAELKQMIEKELSGI